MKISFLVNKDKTLSHLGVLIWGKPEREERELIEFKCTDEQVQDLVFWYWAKLEDGELVIFETEEWLLNKNTFYKVKREAEYPKIGDQLDAIWKGWEAQEAMKKIIIWIKEKHPKTI